MGSPVPAKSILKAQTLPSASRPRLTPLAAVPANPLGHRPPARLPSPDWMGAEPGPRVTNLGAPYSATHTQAQVRPHSPFSSTFPSPPPPPGHWQRLTVPGGAHQLVQHRAHLGLRRHGGGVAGGWTGGGGAQAGPSREGGDKGKG